MNPGILIKASVTPVLVGAATWAGRRWGDALGGWIVGLPLTSGPIVLLVSLDHGAKFGGATAAGVLLGGLSQVGFAVVYSYAAKQRGAIFALCAASAAFGVATVVLNTVSLAVPVALVIVVSGLLIGLRLLPIGGGDQTVASPPRWDIPLRMALATALVIVLTEAAPYLGPHLSGLLSPYPFFAAVLAVFAHRIAGGGAAADVFRGLLYGLGSFCAFFAVAALTLPSLGILSGMLLATAVALCVHGLSLLALRRAIPRD